jgi:hypothetical protein
MMRRPQRRKAGSSQQGYALLLVVFFLALLVITVSAARPNLITEDRRQKEQEMIWRGQQYVRAIRLYYQKTHHFPVQLEDLYEPKTGGIRFLRKAYTDPMNVADGSWRLIYVGPNGQIIGSLNQPASPVANSTTANNSSQPNAPPPDPLATPAFSASDPLGAVGMGGVGGATGSLASSAGAFGGATPSGFGTTTGGSQPTAQAADSGPTISANPIIGVGSKIDRNSIAKFQGEKNYQHFEFIWKIVTADPTTVTPNP